MADYIDRQVLNKYLDECIRESKNAYGTALALAIQKDVNSIPAADVVEIVRCKECQHWKTEHPKANGYHCCYRIHNAFPMREDDFCSRGKRKESEESGTDED